MLGDSSGNDMEVLNKSVPFRCDIFCSIIDNYGDIGVCWRLAKQLANEHKLAVRLWVDNLSGFAKLCPDVNVALGKQKYGGVEIIWWETEAVSQSVGSLLTLTGEGATDIVIEAFACRLSQNFLAAMARQQPQQSVWINLEYLSAEDWVQGCHTLPSPHPTLPLTKYFFFPGFTRETGGLLLESDLFARRDAFQNDTGQQRVFWQSLGIQMPMYDTLKISLFAYENAALGNLFDAWSMSLQPILCLIPEGRILTEVGEYFADATPRKGNEYVRGNLRVRVLPFLTQENYDVLLWACDVNFVRGEDSFVRAHWAGRPFVWQIYPQHDEVHFTKLEAFLNLYAASLGESEQRAVKGLWVVWNQEGDAGEKWRAFSNELKGISSHTQAWANELSKNNLALNLLDFCQKIGRIRAFKIDGRAT